MTEDVPSPIDLRDPADARAWIRDAEARRPWREQVRAAFARVLGAAPVRRVLEIGSGPGLLAERVLRTCEIESYTLFDFSEPMLQLARERLGADPAASFVLGDFKQAGWTARLAAPFDAILAMQSVHEIRHKRHVPALYRELHAIVRPGGLLLVCDSVPPDESARMTALHSTEAEQHHAMTTAGFADVMTELVVHGLYLCSSRRTT